MILARIKSEWRRRFVADEKQYSGMKRLFCDFLYILCLLIVGWLLLRDRTDVTKTNVNKALSVKAPVASFTGLDKVFKQQGGGGPVPQTHAPEDLFNIIIRTSKKGTGFDDAFEAVSKSLGTRRWTLVGGAN